MARRGFFCDCILWGELVDMEGATDLLAVAMAFRRFSRRPFRILRIISDFFIPSVPLIPLSTR